MKTLILVLSVLIFCSSGGLAEEKIFREPIEWCDTWVSSAARDDKPRVLLVGDSIARGYFKAVEKKLGAMAYCARLTTSACVADPAFQQQLELMLTQYHWDLIHFNNGLHGFVYGNKRYEAGYRKALETIRRMAPNAKVILVLSTPLQSTSDKAHLTQGVDNRNRIVKSLAAEFGLMINDLYSISKDHPEYYKDPYHYKPEAICLQSEQVVLEIKKALSDKE